MTARLLSVVVVIAATCCAATCGATPAWWSDAVFYEVFVRSFQDSDGDGIGDIAGLVDRLDYLNDGDPSTTHDLGVTALWLMPIMESPSYHGYDVTDYITVDSDYGTMDDVRRLVREAHRRGIRIVVDLVLNHTSNRHPWFLAALSPQGPRRDWYVWSDNPPAGQDPWGQPVWHRLGSAFYYGLFWSGMPDLNYRNPNVTIAMFEVARFWLIDVGVDGFRLDAVRHLIETDGRASNTAATHFWLKGFAAVVKGWKPDALLVGEVWDAPEAIVPYLDAELDLAFEFSLAEAVLQSVLSGNGRALRSAVDRVLAVYSEPRFATFLSNHDQDRTMTRLGGDAARAKLAASILLTLPGTPFLYYGEEIGMTGAKPDERIRTPMQWLDAAGFGFTEAIPWQPYARDAASRTVAAQSGDPESLLSHYRGLIALRHASAALSLGTASTLASSHPGLFALARTAADESLLILHNLTERPVSLAGQTFSGWPGTPAAATASVVLGSAATTRWTSDATGVLTLPDATLPPLSTLILKLP